MKESIGRILPSYFVGGEKKEKTMVKTVETETIEKKQILLWMVISSEVPPLYEQSNAFFDKARTFILMSTCHVSCLRPAPII